MKNSFKFIYRSKKFHLLCSIAVIGCEKVGKEMKKKLKWMFYAWIFQQYLIFHGFSYTQHRQGRKCSHLSCKRWIIMESEAKELRSKGCSMLKDHQISLFCIIRLVRRIFWGWKSLKSCRWWQPYCVCVCVTSFLPDSIFILRCDSLIFSDYDDKNAWRSCKKYSFPPPSWHFIATAVKKTSSNLRQALYLNILFIYYTLNVMFRKMQSKLWNKR